MMDEKFLKLSYNVNFEYDEENYVNQWKFNFSFNNKNIKKYKNCDCCGKKSNLLEIYNFITEEKIYICSECFERNNVDIFINNLKLNEEDRKYYLDFIKRHYLIPLEDSINELNDLITELNKYLTEDNTIDSIHYGNLEDIKYGHRFVDFIYSRNYKILKKPLSQRNIDNLMNLMIKSSNERLFNFCSISFQPRSFNLKDKITSTLINFFFYCDINKSITIDERYVSGRKYNREYIKNLNKMVFLIKQNALEEDIKFINEKFNYHLKLFYNKEKNSINVIKNNDQSNSIYREFRIKESRESLQRQNFEFLTNNDLYLNF